MQSLKKATWSAQSDILKGAAAGWRGSMTRSGFVRAMEEMLGVAARTLREEDSRDTVAQWSSLVDVQISAMIRSEFSIEPDSELIEAETVGDLLRVLQSRGAFP